MTPGIDQSAQGKSGFRDLKVVAKIVESSLITSFHLEASDGSALSAFRPGQFLVFKIASVDGKGHVLRNYSLSGSPDDLSHYRISVKRESSAGPGLPVGLSSNYLHDCIGVGDVLAVDGPRGAFVLDEASERPVVLLSGGVGLTPMVAMLHALAHRSARRTLFLHACENGDVHGLRDEVNALIGRRPGLSAHYCYRAPSAEDRAAGHFHSEGFITRDVMQSLMCLDDYDFYLCGPPPFMQAMYQTLRGLGVAQDRIAYEFFGPATVLDAETKPKPITPTILPATDGAITVEFRKSGIIAEWNAGAPSLLSFAEDQGIQPDFSCRAGICGTCASRIVSGEVSYFEDPLEDVAPGELLLCCARPKTAIVLDL
ncbi:2Fe-2S iron-sulfur cluster-binding protein [Cypionkella psychrotolerans]|uniref:2Fe-2S iron-sulfur cluster-binding protein n=1 Tax=Cypionkella psychrotolerans TaxID=1678131 RepID=UPI0006B61AE7|nr:2Fe-2S iron-sulfur cluster-binding protein [Cypionkella psychrotolerans]